MSLFLGIALVTLFIAAVRWSDRRQAQRQAAVIEHTDRALASIQEVAARRSTLTIVPGGLKNGVHKSQ